MQRLNNELQAKFFLGFLGIFVLVFVGLVGLGVIKVHPSIEASTYQPERKIVTSTIQATPTPWIMKSHSGVSAKGLIWPIVGPISSPYGPSHPLGIDIDGYYKAGQPIVAATKGTVIFAGGHPCCSYGYYVVIFEQKDFALPRNERFFRNPGIETLYAHLSQILVVQGQGVVQGQALGIIGTTGYSTGPHLHFEVIDNGIRVKPIDYLP